MNNPDDIIINLKVIGSIQPNDKLNTNGNYLNLETVNLISFPDIPTHELFSL